MAEIRTLTTLFDFRTDTAGLKVYEESIARIKGLAMEVGKMFGLYFAIDKITEYVSEVVNAGKEMARINAQITMMARSQDDATAATNSLYDIAQKVGIEYKEIAETYKGFLVDVQDSKVSQEELLTATENVYKALRVGRTSAEEMGAAVTQIERGLRLGRFERRTIGRLIETPGLQQLLLSASGQKNIDALRDLAKQGKITGEQMIEWLSKPNAQLQQQFEQLPQRIDWVFKRIFNQLTYAASQIWKLSDGFSALGRIIWWAFSTASNAVKYFINVLGGLRSTLELVGIALALVIGPYAIYQMYRMIAATAAWAIVNWSALWPWLAIGAAVAAVAVAIQDLWYWFQGKPSLIGTWVGSYKDVKEGLGKSFDDMPIFSFIRAMQDFSKGDFTKGIKDLGIALTDTQGILGTILTLISVSIPAAFAVWSGIKFVELVRELVSVKKAAQDVSTAVEDVSKVKPGVTAPGTTPALPTAPGGPIGPFRAAGQALPYIGLAITTAEILKALSDYMESKYHLTPKEGDKEGWGNVPFTRYWWQKKVGGGEGAWNAPLSPDDKPFGTFAWMREKLGWPTGQTAPGTQPSSVTADGRGGTGPFSMGLNNAALLSSLMTMGAIPFDLGQFKGGIAPGPPPAPNIPITVQQTNNITAMMQPDEAFMADMIEKKIQSTAPDLAGQISRQIQDATPRTEKATQF